MRRIQRSNMRPANQMRGYQQRGRLPRVEESWTLANAI